MIESKFKELEALGQIEGYFRDISHFQRTLEQAPLWLPSRILIKECREALAMIERVKKRFDQKLVCTVIGPSGAGKSTFINALAGIDDLSESGSTRPTTRRAAVFSKHKEDAFFLEEELGKDSLLIHSTPYAGFPEDLLLIDTPDTDSTLQHHHIPIIQKVISLSDILICLFDAENPKKKDHTDFLTPYVQFYDGKSLIVVLNKCDRQSLQELTETIIPDFLNHIQQAWEKKIDSFYPISARSHLQNPEWNPNASPRHSMDQFDALKKQIEHTFAIKGFRIDRRIKNARELKNYIQKRISEETGKDTNGLTQVLSKIHAMEKNAFQIVLETLKNEDFHQISSIIPGIYHRLSQQWMGPVGWLIGVWFRILTFGSSISAFFRFSNPLRWFKERVDVSGGKTETDPVVNNSGRLDIFEPALRQYRFAILERWTDIAEELVLARFDPVVRLPDSFFTDNRDLESKLTGLWISGIEAQISRISKRLSSIWIQIAFNTPVFAVLFHAGWVTSRDFFLGKALPSGYFIHTLLTTFIFLFISFFLFQICVRFSANPSRIKMLALPPLQLDLFMKERFTQGPLQIQISRVMELASLKKSSDE
jgi:GTPase SAR1 family protein